MSINLMQSLGLENVEADPNRVPDNKYDGVVFKSEYVLRKEKDSLSHVVTYKVEGGPHNGAQIAHWHLLGKNVKDAQGNFPDSVDQIASYDNTQTEMNKQFYKKMFVDLGIDPDQVHLTSIDALVGIPVTFGVKTKEGYQNVSFVEKRTGPAAPVAGTPSTEGAASLGGSPAENIAGGLY